MSLEVVDPLAHRALQALMRAETSVRRVLATELEREGVSAAGFSALVVLTTAGGSLELRAMRRESDRRAIALDLTPAGRSVVERLFPAHADRVTTAFARLDDDEKRNLADICRKLAA
jgi:DNA-binding MarR family transcriptional regulator